MKKFKNHIILFLCLVAFVMLFKYSRICKSSVLSSIDLWLTSLVPSMLPIYIISDLLINYGLLNILHRIFKTNSAFLVFISLIAGTPSNAKYIKEFFEEGYISSRTANFLLLFCYSPNPLFIFTIANSFKVGFLILCYIYSTNILLFILFWHKFKNKNVIAPKQTAVRPFSLVLENSIFKSFKILVLILGIVIFYGLINTMILELGINSPFLASLLEMTNAIVVIKSTGESIPYLIFACTFAGLSIHTQIKSILEDTGLSYKYFLLGRLLASIPILIVIILNFY